jgi:hypothetical protein
MATQWGNYSGMLYPDDELISQPLQADPARQLFPRFLLLTLP